MSHSSLVLLCRPHILLHKEDLPVPPLRTGYRSTVGSTVGLRTCNIHVAMVYDGIRFNFLLSYSLCFFPSSLGHRMICPDNSPSTVLRPSVVDTHYIHYIHYIHRKTYLVWLIVSTARLTFLHFTVLCLSLTHAPPHPLLSFSFPLLLPFHCAYLTCLTYVCPMYIR